jgi:hypothetical protein
MSVIPRSDRHPEWCHSGVAVAAERRLTTRKDETLVGQIVGATKDRRLEKIRGQGESCVPHDIDSFS